MTWKNIRQRGSALLLGLFAVSALLGCARTPEDKQAAFLNSGKDYAEQGDHARAALQFQNAIRALPENPEPFYQLSRSQLALGQAREAYLAASKAIDLDPTHSEAQILRAQIMLGSRNPELLERVEENMAQVLAGTPDNHKARYILAATKIRLGEGDAAEQQLRQALENYPQHLKSSVALAVLKLREKDFAGARRVLEEAVQQAPDRPEPAVALGHLYILIGETELAEAQFRLASDRGPQYGPALLAYAGLLVRLGRSSEAGPLYQRASQLPEAKYRPVYAQFLMLEGEYQAGAEQFEALVEHGPKSRANRTGLVAAYLAAGRAAEAHAVLSEALAENPKDVDALLQRAEIHLRGAQKDKAEEDLRRVLDFEASSAEAHYLLAKLHQMRREPLRQRHELGEALRLKPNLLLARLDLAKSLADAGSPQPALDALNEAPEQQRQRLDFVLTRNWILLAMDRFDEVRPAVERALSVTQAPELVLQDAILKLRAGEVATARISLGKVLEANPEELRALSALVDSYLRERQPAKALDLIRAHAGNHPRSARIQYFLGEWLERAGDRAGARAAFQRAGEIDPSLTAAGLAVARLDVAAGRYNEARETLGRLLARDQRRSEARLLLAMVEEAQGNANQAIEQYRQVVQADAQNVVALNNLAYLLANDAGEFDEALRYAQKAKELAPEDPSVDDTIGWTYYRKGHYQTAVAYLERAAEKLDSPAVKYHLAMACAKDGDLDRAREILDQALEQNADLPEAKTAQQLLLAAGAAGR